jgi:hypothetical protein
VISGALNAHVSGASFTYVTAALSEAALITELQAGRPVLRLTSGHIDIVSGCRSSDGSYAGAKSTMFDHIVFFIPIFEIQCGRFFSNYEMTSGTDFSRATSCNPY